jgi:Fe-S-cluster containining protein
MFRGQSLDTSNRAHSVDRVVEAFTEVGVLTRSVADRFEGVFRTYRGELQRLADAAPTFADAARDVIAVLEAAGSSFSTAFPNQPAVDCAAGCAHCCHLAVAVPPGVAEMIADHVTETFTIEARSTLLIRLQSAEAAAAAAADPTALRRRCPLLGADNRCTVYPVRPISCRAFTSPSARRCEALIAGAGPDDGVLQNPSLFRLHRDATAVLEQTARMRGEPATQRGLAGALLDAMDGRSTDARPA